MIAEARDTFADKYKHTFTGEERYWEQVLVLADLAGSLASQWGIISYDYAKAIQWAVDQTVGSREAIEENKLDSFDLLSEYLNEFADTALTVLHTGSKAVPDMSRMPRADIRIRFDVARRTPTDPFDKGTLMLDAIHFRKWVSMRGYDFKGFREDIYAAKADATPRSKKMYMGKDTSIKMGQIYVIGIRLTHPRLVGIFDEADKAADDLVFGQFQVVQ
jgi:hypothetical protein